MELGDAEDEDSSAMFRLRRYDQSISGLISSHVTAPSVSLSISGQRANGICFPFES